MEGKGRGTAGTKRGGFRGERGGGGFGFCNGEEGTYDFELIVFFAVVREQAIGRGVGDRIESENFGGGGDLTKTVPGSAHTEGKGPGGEKSEGGV